jgi:hypothetical protein
MGRVTGFLSQVGIVTGNDDVNYANNALFVWYRELAGNLYKYVSGGATWNRSGFSDLCVKENIL